MQTKLILLNGFAASGKTTLVKQYLDSHPLTLGIEGDALITMLGLWMQYEDKARVCIHELTKSMVSTHLKAGQTVVIPYLLVNSRHAEEFEIIARENNARFYEIYISLDKEAAISRLMKRGSWGESGLPPLTEKDLPVIHGLYDLMVTETARRPRMMSINSQPDDIGGTYRSFLTAIDEV